MSRHCSKSRYPEMTAAQPLVGRERILARAEQLLDEGSGGIVLVGEAGIGKSHIAREVLRLGAERGYAPSAFEAGSLEGPLRISSNIFFLIALHMMSVRR